MKVCESLNSGRPTLSFEFFPPKTEEKERQLFRVIEELKQFRPDFASVTCGALGTNRDRTVYWARQIKAAGIEPVVHLTCVAETKQSVLEQLHELKQLGISNVLALRGDPPEGVARFIPPVDGFRSARELVAFIRGHNFDFCLGVAGYPEGHRESPTLVADTEFLQEKVAAGADYVISQLFFDNKYFFDFQSRGQKAGLKVPLIPGIMPITSLKQVRKMTDICGATIPLKLLQRLEGCEGDAEEVRLIGVEQAVAQCRELLEAGAPGLHFFVMNQSGPISRILQQLTSRKM